jgi:hypothetical protein
MYKMYYMGLVKFLFERFEVVMAMTVKEVYVFIFRAEEPTALSYSLKIDSAGSSETSVNIYRTTPLHILEDSNRLPPAYSVTIFVTYHFSWPLCLRHSISSKVRIEFIENAGE